MLPSALDVGMEPHEDFDVPQCYSELESKANDTRGLGSPVQGVMKFTLIGEQYRDQE